MTYQEVLADKTDELTIRKEMLNWHQRHLQTFNLLTCNLPPKPFIKYILYSHK